MECRNLILYKNTPVPTVISRSFDRFFNYGEVLTETAQVSLQRSRIYEKADGSLVSLYFDYTTNLWQVATRSMAYAEGGDFQAKILKAFGVESIEVINHKISNLPSIEKGFTYIF